MNEKEIEEKLTNIENLLYNLICLNFCCSKKLGIPESHLAYLRHASITITAEHIEKLIQSLNKIKER